MQDQLMLCGNGEMTYKSQSKRLISPISSKYLIAWFAGPWYTNSPLDSNDKVSKVLKIE